MNEDEQDDDKCGAGDDEHIVTARIEYFVKEDEDHIEVKGAAVSSHIHGVPPQVAAQTLLVVVHRAVVGWLAHDVFAGMPSSELAHAMAEASASVYMKQMIDDLPETVQELDIAVPNDISELLGD